MLFSVWPCVRSVPKSAYVCRRIAGRRYPSPQRSFHAFTKLSSKHDNEAASVPWNNVLDELSAGSDDKAAASGGEATPGPPGGTDRATHARDRAGGSFFRRARRNVPRETPKIAIPPWFIDRNVILREEESQQGKRRLGTYSTRDGSPDPSPMAISSEPKAFGKDLEVLNGFRSQIAKRPNSSEQLMPREIVVAEKDMSEEQPGSEREHSHASYDFKPQIETPFSIPDYQIHQLVRQEISAMISSGLQPSPLETPASKPHLVLHCPKDGGIHFLDAVVKDLADVHDSDLIQIDAQDMAELGGELLGDASLSTRGSIRSLGYSTHLMMQNRRTQEAEEEEDEYEDGDDEGNDHSRAKPSNFPTSVGSRPTTIPIITFTGSIVDMFKSGKEGSGPVPTGISRPEGASANFVKAISQPPEKSVEDTKASLLIEALLDACETKRYLKSDHESLQNGNSTPLDSSLSSEITQLADQRPQVYPTSTDENTSVPLRADHAPLDMISSTVTDLSPHTPRTASDLQHDDWIAPAGSYGHPNLILLIRDYVEINATPGGYNILNRLHDIVHRRRKDGQKILIIGTTSSEELIPSATKTGFKNHQLEAQNGPTRTIITPCKAPESTSIVAQDQKDRIRHINLRHLLDMLRQLCPDPLHIDPSLVPSDIELDSALAYTAGLDESVWTFDRVHRAASVIIGLIPKTEKLKSEHISDAIALIESSDAAKFSWIEEDRGQEHGSVGPTPIPMVRLQPDKHAESRMRSLRKSCNAYEKKLLNGVVDPASIRTTFADVQTPPDTIEALKTLTSLSLTRPEAFTYGVLATDKIPGLLLYGPPGVGKTLLAKAVAKESGATVLEVSGSDVYDMYVGEGEKNVKAIFTLAKKLTPCVVFIDEADAIFGSRGSSANRTSHRELINQFLREWDGMNDLSAFIMVATNRPFDLDDAVMRRLPRRLLVDLPTETDREAILKIHLKDEVLGPDVSLSALSAQTPFYSGSDLKNLSVAAALACVREENEIAATYGEASREIRDNTVSEDVPINPLKDSKFTASESTNAIMASATHSPERYKYPEKRTLAKRHFDRAMEEISASISEDMSSLSAIRKFDEKYGDRKGRRKRSSGYGFGTLSEADKNNLDSARVRKQTVI